MTKYSVQLSVGTYARSTRVDAVEAMFAYEDGGRFLIDGDGWGLAIDPYEWRDGEDAVKLLDALVDPERKCPMPARDLMKPQRVSFIKRWLAATQRRFKSPIFSLRVLYIVLVLAFFITGAIASNH